MIQKILIANRGEIACRVIRACREMGTGAVAVFSDPDRRAPHVRMADEAHRLPGASPADTYLAIGKIVDIARDAGCDAVHPGYGFLSENPAFAAAVEDAGLVFIGPSADAIGTMGDKVAARKAAREAGVPLVPGTVDPVRDLEGLRAEADEVGFPLMLKAVAGGGGRGIRIVHEASGLEEAWKRASGEAETAFGNADVYLERFLPRARHVEIQVLADREGKVISLGERDCSLQRRHQKLIEEAPSPAIDGAKRREMGEAAVALAEGIGYRNAGTVEFLYEPDSGDFHFLEMNTRLQVEHPVTELVMGLDLVKAQIRMASGETLPLGDDLAPRGWAIECRLNAEDPAHGFVPATGTVQALTLPGGPWTRVDAALSVGQEIGLHYDSLLAKVIVWGRDREAALNRMTRALRETFVGGVQTTIPFLIRLLESDAFRAGEVDTRTVERMQEEGTLAEATTPTEADGEEPDLDDLAPILAAVIHRHRRNVQEAWDGDDEGGGASPWTMAGRAARLGRWSR